MSHMKRVAYLSLGCDKNRVDTERTLAALADAGFELVPAPEPAFALVVNTCCFIDAAKEESIEAVIEAVREKERGAYRVLAVVGCMVERYREELKKEIPEADLLMGLEHVENLAAGIAALWEKEYGKEREASPSPVICMDTKSRVLITPSHYAFLKIADGCNQACRFCVIPRIRGKLRSEKIDLLVREATALEQAGAKELNLVAQDTTAYGRDLSPPLELADLVERLLAETSIPWIRILYAHPANVTDRLIDLLAGEQRLLKYLDLPLQHINDRILAAMGRKPGRKGIEALLDRLVARAPGLVLRTTFLVGFPGEGEDEFNELIEFVEQGRFFWASGFAYSPQEDTPAGKLPGRPEPGEAEQRLADLFEAQGEVTAARLAWYAGRELTLLVDGPWAPFIEEEESAGRAESGAGQDEWEARFPGMAVEVDGVVRLIGDAAPGELVKATVIESSEYDLVATVIGFQEE